MNSTFKSGALLAAAAAALALAGHASAGTASVSADDNVKCMGINSCKGSGECKTAENACKGQNTCKGHGFVTSKAGACLEKKGKIIGLNEG